MPFRSWRLQLVAVALAVAAAIISAQSFASAREVVVWTVKLAYAFRRRRRTLTADTATEECLAAMWLGAGVENLLGSAPRLVEAVARAFPG